MFRSALVATVLTAAMAAAQEKAKLPKLLSAEPPKPAETDTELQKLMKARYAEVWNEMVLLTKLREAGREAGGGSNSYFNAASRLVSSYLALEPTKEEKLTMLTNYVEMAKDFEAVAKTRVEAGALSMQEMHRATYFRLDAEIQLAKAKDAK